MEGDISANRLPTFKSPRDLTLTNKSNPSSLRSRKQYAPNIPAKRDRSSSASSNPTETPDTTTKRQLPPSLSDSKSRGSKSQNRGREKKKPELVQASSIFSEGVGDNDKSKRTGAPRVSTGLGRRRAGDRDVASTKSGKASSLSSMEKFFRSREEKEKYALENNSSFQEVQSKIHETLGDGRFIADSSDDSDEEGEEDVDPSLRVVSLPLSRYLNRVLDEIASSPVSFPLKSQKPAGPAGLKSEPKLQEATPLATVSAADIETLNFEPLSFAHTLTTAPQEGTIIFLQMPDQLPVLDQVQVQDQAGLSIPVNEMKLSGDIGALPEGYIGKIQILASGASHFILGENSFDIEPAKPVAFRQELAAIDLENKTMTGLGPIKQKYICTPELDLLLRRAV